MEFETWDSFKITFLIERNTCKLMVLPHTKGLSVMEYHKKKNSYWWNSNVSLCRRHWSASLWFRSGGTCKWRSTEFRLQFSFVKQVDLEWEKSELIVIGTRKGLDSGVEMNIQIEQDQLKVTYYSAHHLVDWNSFSQDCTIEQGQSQGQSGFLAAKILLTILPVLGCGCVVWRHEYNKSLAELKGLKKIQNKAITVTLKAKRTSCTLGLLTLFNRRRFLKFICIFRIEKVKLVQSNWVVYWSRESSFMVDLLGTSVF